MEYYVQVFKKNLFCLFHEWAVNFQRFWSFFHAQLGLFKIWARVFKTLRDFRRFLKTCLKHFKTCLLFTKTPLDLLKTYLRLLRLFHEFRNFFRIFWNSSSLCQACERLCYLQNIFNFHFSLWVQQWPPLSLPCIRAWNFVSFAELRRKYFQKIFDSVIRKDRKLFYAGRWCPQLKACIFGLDELWAVPFPPLVSFITYGVVRMHTVRKLVLIGIQISRENSKFFSLSLPARLQTDKNNVTSKFDKNIGIQFLWSLSPARNHLSHDFQTGGGLLLWKSIKIIHFTIKNKKFYNIFVAPLIQIRSEIKSKKWI